MLQGALSRMNTAMSRTIADVLVIGGGCIGAAAAYHLSLAGVLVTLVERRALASGTTAQSSAIVRQHYSIPTLARMAHDSLRVFSEFADLVGGEIGFRQTGLLIGARAEDLNGLRATVETGTAIGIDARLIDRDELRAIEPRMDLEGLVGACFEPAAGYADPTAVTVAYATQARFRGAQLRQGLAVSRLLVDGDRVRGVALADGTEVHAGAVLIASNIWGVALLRDVGVDLPIHATRHPCILLQRPGDFGERHAIVFDFTNGLYLKPEAADLTLAGTLDEAEVAAVFDPDRFDTRPSHEETAMLAARTARRFPAMADATLQAGWAGLYDVSADWQPAIGPVPGIEGLYAALGFSGHGFKLCPAVGDLLAAQILGRADLPYDPSIFRVERFASGTLARSRYSYGIIG